MINFVCKNIVTREREKTRQGVTPTPCKAFFRRKKPTHAVLQNKTKHFNFRISIENSLQLNYRSFISGANFPRTELLKATWRGR